MSATNLNELVNTTIAQGTPMFVMISVLTGLIIAVRVAAAVYGWLWLSDPVELVASDTPDDISVSLNAEAPQDRAECVEESEQRVLQSSRPTNEFLS